MKVIYPLIAVLLLALVAYLGSAAGLEYLFGVIIPYVSLLLFLGGFSWKIYDWVK
jgi:nitrate reductase gamma subunit